MHLDESQSASSSIFTTILLSDLGWIRNVLHNRVFSSLANKSSDSDSLVLLCWPSSLDRSTWDGLKSPPELHVPQSLKATPTFLHIRIDSLASLCPW